MCQRPGLLVSMPLSQFYIGLLLFSVGFMAHAQYGSQPESIIVTGSYDASRETTAVVSILDSNQIAALHKSSVADLLKTLPGVLVEEQGGPGGLTAVSIRGAESNFTLVLIDGVPVNDPTNTRGGGFDFGNIQASQIERIELVYGAQSAIYGSDALAGVIQVFTRNSNQDLQQQVFIEGGSSSYSNITARLGGVSQDFNYSMVVGAQDSGVGSRFSSRDNRSARFHFGWIGDDHSVDIQAGVVDGSRKSFPEQSGGVAYATSRELDDSDYEEQSLSAFWRTKMGDKWSSSVKLSRVDRTENTDSPGISPFLEVPPNASDTDFTRSIAQWANTFRFSTGANVVLGVDYKLDDGKSVGFLDYFGTRFSTDFQLKRQSMGYFAALHSMPLDELSLQATVRQDDPEGFGDELSSGIGLRYEFSPDTSLAINWGEAFKLPSFFALGHTLVGNPDLQPETVESLDISVNWSPHPDWQLNSSIFSNDYQNLVDFDESTFRNVNRSRIETRGYSLGMLWRPALNLEVSGHLTRTDFNLRGQNTVLTGRPERKGGLSVSWQVLSSLLASVDIQYSGKQWAVSRHTGSELIRRLDSFTRTDFSASWSMSEKLEWHLSLDNVFDSSYETAVGFPAPGRVIRLGLTASF